ncbi:hypothetical protein BDB01DRAFT_838579 [Pilobolus umbonatus]|nr:hypothetical protein BDB01DRAFT_838579 [Pilobolus umbonatus]
MSFRPPRSLPILTLFHNAKSEQSNAALNLLRQKQMNSSGEEGYRIDVQDKSTEYQLKQVASYLHSNTPWKDMVDSDVSDGNDALSLLMKRPELLKCPIIVDWEKGKAATALTAIEKIIDERQKK